LVEPDHATDERGSFTTLFAADTFRAHGLDVRIAQTAVSRNRRRGTLRGLHYQIPPFAQAKLVRCCRGFIYDVVVDLRPESATVGRWFGMELSATAERMLYLPAGLAHGFLTLEDDTDVLYHLSAPRQASAEGGIRWDDPALAIAWPLEPAVISERDRAFPLLEARMLVDGLRD
jgi:dTDP-4-dehydrorhamnose 3,5-epimerase